MMDKIVRAIDHNGDTYGWLDSKVVLHWITNPSGRRWSVYVRNRVATINGLCPLTKWSYVATKENPADLVSRGSTTENLLSSSLWFHGPSWLTAWTGHPDEEPTSHDLDFSAEELEELVLCNVVAVSGRNEFLNDLLERFSSYDRLLRVLAVVLRFVQRLKKKVSNSDYFTTVDEIRTAELIIFNLAQRDEYGEEIACIQHGKDVPSKSKIAPLAPFLDSDGLLRVGGRIRNSSLTYEAKHPMLLPRGGPLMELIVRAVHEQCAHGGPTLTLARLRHKYWLIAGTRTVKRIIHQCVRCHRARPRPLLQKMGDLPSPRVNLSKPFGTTGLDFAGPFSVKWNHGRGTRTTKAYVCVFVCLAIKAVHLELVSDLSSESFIAALKRFVARRGPVAEIQSDNATNFVGAVRMLSEIQSRVATVGIKWSFIPPSAPHFGGLWEAGVKSLKTHMAKVMTSTIYTWEEFETMLCLIEMSLNSRPLCPLTDELDSLDALTPNHFVNGTYVVPVPEDGGSLSMRNRWELCTSQYQQVVDRFKQEYLSRLQSRPKWCKATSNLRVGQLVLIKEENLAATEWRMGRITEVHLGADGLVRVAKLKTRRGEITRPIAKLSPLPVDNPDPN
jgi:transposase InsO family protein